MKKLLFAAVVVSLLAPAGTVLADDVQLRGEADASVRSGVKANASFETEVKSPRDAASGQSSGKRVAGQDDDGDGDMEEAREARAEAMRESQEKFAEDRAELKDRLEAARESMKDRIEAARADFKVRIEAFKDKQKATITERININLNKVNENITSMFMRHLDKMTELVRRAEARASTTATAEFTATVASARAAIVAADAAVTVQAATSYTIAVNSEATVRADVKALRDKLHSDLAAVKAKVEAAKEAVRKIFTLEGVEASVRANASGTVQ